MISDEATRLPAEAREGKGRGLMAVNEEELGARVDGARRSFIA